jgi:hypothetical protein
VTLSEILQAFVNRRIIFSPQDWAMAYLLGKAREASNYKRAANSDRGQEGNEAVDLLGSMGELVVLRRLQAVSAKDAFAAMQSHMFSAAGGADVTGPDVHIIIENEEWRIDIKSFDCADNKKFFAINNDKHESLRGNCDGYVGLISPPLSRLGITSKIVPYADVDNWPKSKLRVGGTPSRNLPIGLFSDRYIEAAEISGLRGTIYDAREVRDLAALNGPGSPRYELTNIIPTVAKYI